MFFGDESVEAVAERARRDTLPIPDRGNREGYGKHGHAAYWCFGLVDHDKVVAAAERLGISGGRYYDFGGSTGRVFRQFSCQDEGRFEVWSSDLQLSSFLWNQRNMPTDVRIFVNGFAPPLPIPDAHFDVVTAFSVFTHIDELESPWLLELRRILKPGGLLYATVHDERLWEVKSDELLESINKSRNGTEVTADTPFPTERTAFHFRLGSYYGCNVFHPEEYIRREWGRYFEIVDVRPQDHQAQCVVLLTPR
jgi:SAM-dependent methyltransferase